MAVDESLKRDRPVYAKRSLMELVSAAASPEAAAQAQPVAVSDEPEFSPPPRRSDPLPRPGDPYRPHARYLKMLNSDPKLLHFIHGDFVCDGFSYHDLRRLSRVPADRPGNGPALVLRFIEAVVVTVTITGRNLDDLHRYIDDGWLPWVWEQPKGFRVTDDHATVITGITICEEEK